MGRWVKRYYICSKGWKIMEDTIEQFISFVRDIKHVSNNTALSYKRDLMKMCNYFKNQGITTPDRINATNINTYILWLEKNGCAAATISRYIAAMKSYFHYLLQKGIISSEPTTMLKSPSVTKKAPNVLTVEEIENLLNQPSTETTKGIRDKAMLELMYATGMRVTELIELKVSDINFQLGYVVCKDANKERIIPFGIPAKNALNRYMEEARGALVKDSTDDTMFVNCMGHSMSRQGFWKIIKSYGEKAGIESKITPHIIRHSFAVQEMLGHSVISTTQVYAEMKGTKLRGEYTKSHPRSS
jgi:integrase/recombinase XerD